MTLNRHKKSINIKYILGKNIVEFTVLFINLIKQNKFIMNKKICGGCCFFKINKRNKL